MHAVFVLNVLNDCMWGMFLYIYKYMNTTKEKFSEIKIAKRARRSEDINCEIL